MKFFLLCTQVVVQGVISCWELNLGLANTTHVLSSSVSLSAHPPFCFLVMPGIKPRASHIQGKCCATELHIWPHPGHIFSFCIFIEMSWFTVLLIIVTDIIPNHPHHPSDLLPPPVSQGPLPFRTPSRYTQFCRQKSLVMMHLIVLYLYFFLFHI